MSLYIVDIHGELEGDYEIIKKYEEPTTKNNCAEQNGCITCSLDDGDDCCRKLYEESMQEPTTKNNLGVEEVTALAEWTEKLTKASEDAYNKGYADGMKELGPIMTKDKFKYGLTACGCLLKDGKTWYEHNELIECFENLGLLENPHTKNKESMTTNQKYLMACDYAIHQLIKTGSSQLSIIKGNTWIDVPFAEVLNWLEEEYKQTNADRSVEE